MSETHLHNGIPPQMRSSINGVHPSPVNSSPPGPNMSYTSNSNQYQMVDQLNHSTAQFPYAQLPPNRSMPSQLSQKMEQLNMNNHSPTVAQTQFSNSTIHPSYRSSQEFSPSPAVTNQPSPTYNGSMPPSNHTRYPNTNYYTHNVPASKPLPQNNTLAGIYNYNQPQYSTSGIGRLMGYEHCDLLQRPNILPTECITAPQIQLGQEALNVVNCCPEIFRCTMTKIPETASLLQKSRLPLGVLIHPFRDLSSLPVMQSNVIVRCRSCRTYINPFVYFVDSKRWKCNLCYRINDLPEEFNYDPVSKSFGVPSRRPEIKHSTIEYIAPAEYMLRPPQPAVYLFLLDISRLAIECGYLTSFCATLREELRNLPGDSRTLIGFLAYDSALHFFSFNDEQSRPHEMIVLDIDEAFVPTPDNLLVNLKDNSDLIQDFLNDLPTKYTNTFDGNSALGVALQMAYKLMTSTGGRVTVCQACLPNFGPGALISREDPSQRASGDVQFLNPANDFYKRLALECSGQHIAVDLFVLNSQYVDVATISGISQFSGGCVHHIPLFKNANVLNGELFERMLKRYLTRKIGFEAVMRIRCTRGLSIHTFHGNFFVRSTDLLSLPNINPDAGFGMQVAIDEALTDVHSICFQAALLYTSSEGDRRIRVHTLCLPVASTLHDVLHAADQQCIIGLLGKMAVDRSIQSSLADAREAFINVAIDILSSYKLAMNISPQSCLGGLIVPDCLNLLPLYISALLKYNAFRTGVTTRLDDRIKAMLDMKSKPLAQLIRLIYPDLYPVHNLDEYAVITDGSTDDNMSIPQPPHLQLTARCLDGHGAYLLDKGEHMIILVNAAVRREFFTQALGVDDYTSITDDMYELPILNNATNQMLHQFIRYLNYDKPIAATLHIIRDNSRYRVGFYEYLIEDRVENALSYHEFLQHLKTQIK